LHEGGHLSELLPGFSLAVAVDTHSFTYEVGHHVVDGYSKELSKVSPRDILPSITGDFSEKRTKPREGRPAILNTGEASLAQESSQEAVQEVPRNETLETSDH
jgi:hypothetical protein